MTDRSVLRKAREDHWQYRVTLRDGRVFVCSEIHASGVDGFVTLIPLDDAYDVDVIVFRDTAGGRRGVDQSQAIRERCIDVNLRYIVSVEDGAS